MEKKESKFLSLIVDFIDSLYRTFGNEMTSESENKIKKILDILNNGLYVK